MRFSVSSRGYYMFSRNISYRNDNFSLRNQARSITMVIDERGMTGAGIFDSIKNFGKKVINFGSKAGKSAYNAVNSALPYIEKGIDIIDKFGPVVDSAMERNQHKLHPRINNARKSSKKFVNKRRKDYESAKPVIDMIQSLRGSKIPEANENDVIQREKTSKPKLPAFDLKQQLINQSKNLKKSKPSKRNPRNDPMAELKARLSHIRNNVADDSDDWDGAGLYPAGAGLYPAGAGLYPAGAGLYPAGAGLNPAGSGMCGKGLARKLENPSLTKIIPHVVNMIMNQTDMSKKGGKQLLLHSLEKAQPLLNLTQKGSGKVKGMHKTVAKLAITPLKLLNPNKTKVIKSIQTKIENMVKKGKHGQKGGNFWDTLKSIAGTIAPFVPLLL